MIPETMLPAPPTAEPPTPECICVATPDTAVLIPTCIPWVTAESAARFFIDDGLVFVSASCVFSSFNSCVESPCVTITRGMRDLDDVAAAPTAVVDGMEASAAGGPLALGTALP